MKHSINLPTNGTIAGRGNNTLARILKPISTTKNTDSFNPKNTLSGILKQYSNGALLQKILRSKSKKNTKKITARDYKATSIKEDKKEELETEPPDIENEEEINIEYLSNNTESNNYTGNITDYFNAIEELDSYINETLIIEGIYADKEVIIYSDNEYTDSDDNIEYAFNSLVRDISEETGDYESLSDKALNANNFVEGFIVKEESKKSLESTLYESLDKTEQLKQYILNN